MSDSDKALDLTQPSVFTPPAGSTEIVVRNADGKTFSTRLKDEKGKFIRKRKPMPEANELTRLMRTLLNQAEADADGRLTHASRTRVRRMFDNMVAIATNEDKDPKALMAAVKAFEVLMARAYGKVQPSDQELGALERAGVKIVVVQPPELNHPMVTDQEKKKPEQPSFADAEVIQQN